MNDVSESEGARSRFRLCEKKQTILRFTVGCLSIFLVLLSNGVELSQDEQFLFVAETGGYRIWKIAVKSDQTDIDDSPQATVLLDNLPGGPDNVTRGLDGGIGSVYQSSAPLDWTGWRRTLASEKCSYDYRNRFGHSRSNMAMSRLSTRKVTSSSTCRIPSGQAVWRSDRCYRDTRPTLLTESTCSGHGISGREVLNLAQHSLALTRWH